MQIDTYKDAFKTFVSFSRFIIAGEDGGFVAPLMIASLFNGGSPAVRPNNNTKHGIVLPTSAESDRAVATMNRLLVGATAWITDTPIVAGSVTTARRAVFRCIQADENGVCACLADPYTDAAVLKRKVYLWRGATEWEATIMAFENEDPFICAFAAEDPRQPVMLFWSLDNKITEKTLSLVVEASAAASSLKAGDVLRFAPRTTPAASADPAASAAATANSTITTDAAGTAAATMTPATISQDAWLNMWQSRLLCTTQPQ